jgi:hypothetical protein
MELRQMASSKPVLERQLEQCKSVLATRAKKLADSGVAADARPRDPKWRALSAACAHLEARIQARGKLIALEAELQQRKAEKAAAAAAPPEEEVKAKKEKKEKKPAAEKPKKKKEEAAAEE